MQHVRDNSPHWTKKENLPKALQTVVEKTGTTATKFIRDGGKYSLHNEPVHHFIEGKNYTSDGEVYISESEKLLRSLKK